MKAPFFIETSINGDIKYLKYYLFVKNLKTSLQKKATATKKNTANIKKHNPIDHRKNMLQIVT